MVRTILISDDDRALTRALARLVKTGGFKAITDNDSQVVGLAEEHQPSLIVLDVGQRVDGRTLLGALKTNLRTADIPVVVLTGNAHPTLQGFCRALGASDVIQKPVSAELVRRIGELAGVPGQSELEQLTSSIGKHSGPRVDADDDDEAP